MYEYDLFDLQGALIIHAKDFMIDLTSLSKGTYLLRIGQYTQMVIKH